MRLVRNTGTFFVLLWDVVAAYLNLFRVLIEDWSERKWQTPHSRVMRYNKQQNRVRFR